MSELLTQEELEALAVKVWSTPDNTQPRGWWVMVARYFAEPFLQASVPAEAPDGDG